MSRERLSKLQKIILNYLIKDELRYKKEFGHYEGSPYHGVLLDIARKYGADMEKDIPGYVTNIWDESFKSSFSRSLKNLVKKGLIKIEMYQNQYPIENYMYVTGGKISDIKLTKKGKEIIK